MEDEKRLWRVSLPLIQNDSVSFATITSHQLYQPILDTAVVRISGDKLLAGPDQVLYLGTDKAAVFTETTQTEYAMICSLDANLLKPGSYIVSLHYHTAGKTYREAANTFVVAKAKGEEYNWQDVLPLKVPSGFGQGFSIIERRIDLEAGHRYEFFIFGNHSKQYRVSDFLLRPEGKSVVVVKDQGDTLYNNCPR